MSESRKSNATYPAIFDNMTFLLWPPQTSAVQKMKARIFSNYGAKIAADSTMASVSHILVKSGHARNLSALKKTDSQVVVDEKWANDSIDKKKALDIYPYIIRSRKRPREDKILPDVDPKPSVVRPKLVTQELPKKASPPPELKTEQSSNDLLIQIFRELASERQNNGNEFSGRAYLRAVHKLQTCSKPIHSYNDARAVGLSTKLSQLVDDISQGKIPDAVRKNTRDKSQVITLFQTLYGVGPKTAAEYYHLGYRTLDDIKKHVTTPSVLVSLEHHADLVERISRLEVTQHFDVVKAALQDVDKDASVFCMGSYRRGQPDCGDIDVILTKPGCEKRNIKKLVTKLVQELVTRGFAKYTFGGGVGSRRWLGATCLENGKWRRMDILGVPHSELGAAFIYYTGNDTFNRMLRLRAQRMGMRLNERGLFNRASEELIESSDEKRIFELLKVKWREPTERVIL